MHQKITSSQFTFPPPSLPPARPSASASSCARRRAWESAERAMKEDRSVRPSQTDICDIAIDQESRSTHAPLGASICDVHLILGFLTPKPPLCHKIYTVCPQIWCIFLPPPPLCVDVIFGSPCLHRASATRSLAHRVARSSCLGRERKCGSNLCLCIISWRR